MSEIRGLASAAQIRRDVAELIRPPRRVPVSVAASENMEVVDGAGRKSLWNPDTTPYMTEPMDCLSSRLYDAVIFVGPARSGKTMGLVDGFVCYMVSCDPSDMLIIQISEDKAREYSKKRLDRMLRGSPNLEGKLSPRAHDNNVHDKIFKAGNYLGIKWPSKNVMASSDYRFTVVTDYDRLPLDIGGEGDAFTMTSKRTQTFGSTGMTLIESSPGKEIIDPDWRRPAENPHMSPPAPGIMELYNRGDRRRLYWQCDHCGEWYQPILENWNAEAFQTFCNHCGCLTDPKRKRVLNRAARWVPEGCQLSPEGELIGQRRNTRIASFWMEGPAAAYQSWPSLGQKLVDAEISYENTDSQETLKSVLNTDWARPYLHRTSANQRSSERLMEKSEGLAKRVVPKGARFLTAAIDVQAGKHRRFVVQVHAWGVGKECWIVDRFNIAEDKGPNGDDDPRRVDPGSRPEDWDLLTRDVLNRSYRIEGHEGARMQIHLTAVDTGGEDGVTLNAYDWYRRLRRSGLQGRAMLIKGASTRTPHPIRETRPNNTGRKDRKTNVKGDVPLWMLGTDLLKDAVASMLTREEPGPNYLHIPDWLGRWWHDEMTYEIRRPDGKWEAPGKKPNEAFDLSAYNLAAFIKAGGERIKWNAPPSWAREPGHNPLVTMGDEQRSDTNSTSPAKRKRQPRYRFGSR